LSSLKYLFQAAITQVMAGFDIQIAMDLQITPDSRKMTNSGNEWLFASEFRPAFTQFRGM